MSPRDTITLEKSILYRIGYTVPLCSLFLYFTKLMLFGPNILWLPGVTVNEQLQINFVDKDGKVYLSGHSEFNMPEGQTPAFCRFQQNNLEMGCLEHDNDQLIKITIDESGQDGVTCHQVRREGRRCVNQMVKDCYSLGSSHWYGGFESNSQHWPLRQAMPVGEGVLLSEDTEPRKEGVELTLSPYVSGDYGVHGVELLNILERLFISSNGVGIMVSEETPLYLSFNQHGDSSLCVAAMYDGSHYFSPLGKPPVLEYTVCKADDVRKIHSYMRRRFLLKPEAVPNEELFKYPIWSTWAQYKKDINQSAVMDFAAQITAHEFPYSQLEIDDDWTPRYGDLDFDSNKFPDPKKMVEELTNQGFPVTLWTHPFLSLKSKAFQEAIQNKYTVMARGSELPALVKWWNEDMSALLDVTNPAAVQWYQKKLFHLQKAYNITSFKFDAGEARFVPDSHHTLHHMKTTNEYSLLWAELAFSSDPINRRQEVRVGWNSQRLPTFVRMMDRMSTWAVDGGLQSVIPAALTLGLIGYPFILPDMIGGNAYFDIETLNGGDYPEKELYIRWLEVNIFLPSLQFSIAPWTYDEEVIAVSKRLLKIREKYTSKIVELAKESTANGNPIVRPLWWLDPHSEEALTVDDQFLLGNDLVVAPVVVEGARKRDIYLPYGNWEDKLRGGTIKGPTHLKDYSVALEELPFFERIQ